MAGADQGGAPKPAHRDPWAVGGTVLLAVLSAVVIVLYRSAPQSVAEARTGLAVAARPDAFGPRLARAEQELAAALDAREAGADSAAALGFAAATRHGWAARRLASDRAERREATAIWAQAMLELAELMRAAGSESWWRGDDEEELRRALELVHRVLAVSTVPATRRRAAELRDRIQDELRPGPLEDLPEWLPELS